MLKFLCERCGERFLVQEDDDNICEIILGYLPSFCNSCVLEIEEKLASEKDQT